MSRQSGRLKGIGMFRGRHRETCLTSRFKGASVTTGKTVRDKGIAISEHKVQEVTSAGEILQFAVKYNYGGREGDGT